MLTQNRGVAVMQALGDTILVRGRTGSVSEAIAVAKAVAADAGGEARHLDVRVYDNPTVYFSAGVVDFVGRFHLQSGYWEVVIDNDVPF